MLSFVLIDLISIITRGVESTFTKDNKLLTLFFTEKNFADNSRYFLEYLQSNPHHGYKIRILIQHKLLFQQIESLYPQISHYSKSFSGFKLFFKTKNIVISHGSDASYFFPYFLNIHSKNIINLWHGIPIKRLSLQVKGIREGKSRNRFQKFSAICAASIFEQFLLASCFDMHIDDVWLTGTPRNDYLLSPNNNLVHVHPYLSKKVILYAPTWREYGKHSSFFPFEDKDMSAINNFLIREDAYLLLRGHREEMELISSNYSQNESFSRIMSADQELFPDVQQLLPYTDVLLTDYSSIYFDYLLVDKPIIFLPYDLEEYQLYRGFLFDYDAHTPGVKVFNQLDFLKELEMSLNIPETRSEERSRMRDLFHIYQNGGSSARILMQINKLNS